jgi:hypothetical protein
MASHTDGYFFSSAHCKHIPCSTLAHSTNEDLFNIKHILSDAKSLTLSHMFQYHQLHLNDH